MAIPKITDLVLYVSKKITGADWNSNWQKLISWLTGGSADVKFNSVDTNSVTTSGTITTNGATINGNADISGNLNVGGVISGDGSGLTGVQSTSTIAWTPFTVNKGYLDNSGNEKLMEIKIGDTTKISFEDYVNDGSPITATTSDGVNFTLNQLDEYDCSNQGTGTYIVCIKKNQQRAELRFGVYRQRIAPTSVPDYTLWLDTSVENIQCYEWRNGSWNKYDGVPIGEVEITSGTIDSVTTYKYNWNGYNINVQEEINIEQRPSVIIKTWYADNINWSSKQTQTDSYEVYSNGLIVQSGRISWNSGSASYEITLPLSITISKVCSVKLTNTYLTGNNASGSLKSISGGTIKVNAGSTGSNDGVLLWEVKGYK